jgi:hypothetical protein
MIEPAQVFQLSAEPELWTNGPTEESDRPEGEEQWYAFGYWCGNLLCLIPFADNVSEERRNLWLSPICKTEEDAKRMWFIVKMLMVELDKP